VTFTEGPGAGVTDPRLRREPVAIDSSLDPITFEVITNALDSIADEAAIVMFRSAYSAIVRDSLDYSTAVFDHRGRLLAQGLTTALHLGSFPDAMRNLVDTYGDDVELGDVFIFNDPYGSGGMHLPDVYVVKAVFHRNEHVGFVTTLSHMADIGGITPGSNPVHSTEIFQEGLRIPLVKLYRAGVADETLLKVIAQNTRLPVKVLGDLRAQLAGCTAAERSLEQLFSRHGRATLERYFEGMFEYSERMMRRAIRELPDGEYEFVDYIDGLGNDPHPIEFHVKVVIDGDEMTVDWAGTSPQVRAGINAPFPFTKAATYLAARLLIRQDVPNCEGYMAPLHTVAPAGTIVNPVEPAGCATRGITGCRALETILGALAKAKPDLIPAAPGGDNYWPTIGGYHDGRPFVYVESIMGTWGGRPNRDGTEGVPHPAGNQPNQPIEMVEARQPLQITQYGFVPDTGGAGLYRGGLSLVREYRLLADEAMLTLRTGRRTYLPYGLQGGRQGTAACTTVNPGPDERILPALPMEAVTLQHNDILRIMTAGGGGWGDPHDRDPLAVLNDVLDGKLTPAYAKREYGVVFDTDLSDVDVAATTELRERIRLERQEQSRSATPGQPATPD
jgi:N-methylhydantoinase B